MNRLIEIDPFFVCLFVYFSRMPPSLHLGDDDFLQVVDDLLADHDDGQLLSQLHQAASVAALRSDFFCDQL